MSLSKCVNCESENLKNFVNSEINPEYLMKVNTLICCDCGLVFKNLKLHNTNYLKSIKKNYYSNFKIKDLETRFKSRIIFDKSRAKVYYELIKSRIKLNKVIKVIDVGGAEGWFANYLKINHPNFEVYNLEPDINAVKIGRLKYPKVRHIVGRLEDIDKKDLKNIDLITYWGGFYRTAEPRKVINKIYNLTSKKANLFFSLPYTFDNPVRQDNTPYGSLDEIIGNGNIIFLNHFYMERLFERNFEIKEKKMIQNFPFQKKIPVFHMQKREIYQKKEYKYNKSSFRYTYNFLKNYCFNQSILNLNKFYKKYKITKICVWANPQYYKEIEIIFKKTKVKKCEFLHEDQWQYKKLKSINDIYKIKPDALFITDFINQDLILDQIKNRLHIEKVKIVKILDNKYINQKIFEKFNQDLILKKVFLPIIF